MGRNGSGKEATMLDLKAYQKVHAMVVRDVKRTLEEFPIKWKDNNARIMDIGCGDGSVIMEVWRKYIPENFMNIVCSDKNQSCVDFARERYGGERAQFMRLDIEEQVPMELKGSFDHIVSSYTFHWVNLQETAFTNVYEMLTEGGSCLLIFLGYFKPYENYRKLSHSPKWSEGLKHVATKFMSPYHDSQMAPYIPPSEMSHNLQNVDFGAFTAKDILNNPPLRKRRTVIFVSLANRTVTEVDVQKLMEEGMNVARFMMPHQSKGDKIRLMDKIEKASRACCEKYNLPNWPLATCVDLKTRVVRTGLLEALNVNRTEIKMNTKVILTCDMSYFNKCNADRIFVDNYELGTEVKVGMEMSIDADEIAVVCTEVVDAKTVKTIVTKGGLLSDMSTVCFRNLKTSRPFLTKSDTEIIKLIRDIHVDAIAVNYVDDADSIRQLKKLLGKKTRRPIILSGIGTEEGMNNFDEIAKESDGIIISREHLPYTVRASYRYKINNMQKWLVGKCHQAGRPIYVSGAVLRNNLRAGKPRISEISNASNAILDGVTGFILRDCEDIDTTLETVKLLNDICCNIEPYTCTKSGFWRFTDQYRMPMNSAEGCVVSCVALANQINAHVIILPTVSGRTAKALLQMRPYPLILAVCTNVRVTKMLQMFNCMVPLLYSGEPSKIFRLTIAARINFAVEHAVKMDWLRYGDPFVVLKRHSEGSSYCDTVDVLSVTISKNSMMECADDCCNCFENYASAKK